MLLAIEIVYELTACGFTINILKCRLDPCTVIKYLGIIIDAISELFRLPRSRALRMTVQVQELLELSRASRTVPATKVAQLLGLLWAAAPCSPRAVAIMSRGLIECLKRAMRKKI